MKMENTQTIITIGITTVILIISFYVYKSMGCNTSSTAVSSSKSKDKEKKKDEENNKYPAGNLSIYFGSQTGTAEGFSRTLMEEGKAAGFNAKVIDLEDFDADVLINSTSKAIFLMATYGEGEPTDNATSFTKWMKNENDELESDVLKKLNFTVFGLGNKQYEHYNKMGKTTNKNLSILGAKRMFDYGEGDDDGTLEEDFEAWKAKLWPALIAAYHPDKSEASSLSHSSTSTAHKVNLTFQLSPSTVDKKHDMSTIKVNTTTKHFFTAPRASVIVNRELRNVINAESGSTRHIEIDLKSVNLSYHTADNLAILPENNSNYVAQLAKTLGYDLDYKFDISPIPGSDDEKDFKYAFPTPCTVREVLTQYLDIQGPMKQSMLKHLVHYVKDIKQVEWLQDLLTKPALIKQLVEEEGLSLYELLTNQLTSCHIPLIDFLHLVPYIQPRFYTISSSSSCHPNIVHITVSITEYKLKSGKNFIGLTSGYIKELKAKSTNCRIFIRESSFRLPKSMNTPIIMIGPGTGIAPMRALLQERQYQSKSNSKCGDNILFFGCKHQLIDYIYRDELEVFQKENVLNDFYVAFSRDTSNKEYVQHLMKKKEISMKLVKLIDDGAYVYVCGATAMGTDVMNAFHNIIAEHKNINPDKVNNYIKDLQQNGRYVQELWTA